MVYTATFWGKTTRITVKLLANYTTEINQQQEVVIFDHVVTHLCCHTGIDVLLLDFRFKHL